jgi:predicted membrane protein (TIGR00267 family)
MSLSGSTRLGARVRRRFATLRHYHEIADVGEIARRYFPMNAFDGVLTALGIVTGAYFGGVTEPSSLVVVIASASLSLGVSGFYGSYLSEQAERTRALRELEDTMLSRLDSTDVGSAARYATFVIAAVAGFASAVGGLIMCIPLALQSVLGVAASFYAAWAVAAVELVLLGVFLGRVSRGRLIVSSVKLVLAGGVAFGLSLLLNVAGV